MLSEPLPRTRAPTGSGARSSCRGPGSARDRAGETARRDGQPAAGVLLTDGHQDLFGPRNRYLPRAP